MTSLPSNDGSSRSQRFAFVTLVTTDHYLPGALVLAHSLRQAHTTTSKPAGALTPADLANLGAAGLSNRTSIDKKVDLVCLVTPATVSVRTVKTLVRYFDKVVGVEPLSFSSLAAAKANERGNPKDRHSVEAKAARKVRNETRQKLALLGRPDLGETSGAALTKLHAWRLTGYDKIVFLDADILVLRPITHLFSITSSLAASPDIGWPDAFNSGLMVLTPSLTTFSAMREFAIQSGSWDGADQGFLNDFFGGEHGSIDAGPGGGWQRLPFRYNVTPNAGYTFAPAYERYGSGIMTAHFIGQHKPWNRPKPSAPSSRSSSSQSPANYDSLLYRWHVAFEECYPQVVQMKNGSADVIHTERGVEVVEKPFTVPSYKAVWDLEGRGDTSSHSSGTESSSKRSSIQRIRGIRTPSTHNLFRGAGQAEDLKEMFSPAVIAASAAAELESLASNPNVVPNEGVYISLPLDNRTSLMAAELDSGDDDDRFSDSDQTLHQSPPVDNAQIRPISIPKDDAGAIEPDSGEWSPPKVSWDPAREPPPSGGGSSEYQMRVPVDAFYVNAWDQPLAEQRRNANAHSSEGRSESQKRTLDKLQREHFFDNLGSVQPDIRKVKPVFPWEASSAKPTSSRTFPDEPASVVPGSSDMQASHEAGSSNSPEGGSNTEDANSEQTRKGGFPAIITYTNAWDHIDLRGKGSRRPNNGSNTHNSRATQAQVDQSHRGTQTKREGRSRTSSYAPQNNNGGGHQDGHDTVSADQSGDGDNESSSSSDEEVERGGASWRREGPGPGYQRRVESHQILSRSPRHTQQQLATSPSLSHYQHAGNHHDQHHSLHGSGSNVGFSGSNDLLGSDISRTRSRSSSNASNGGQHASIPHYGNVPPSLRSFYPRDGRSSPLVEEGFSSLSMPYEQLLASHDRNGRRRMGIRTPTASQPGSANNSGSSSPIFPISTPPNMSPNHSRHDLSQLSRHSNTQFGSRYVRRGNQSSNRPYM
ncbi:nucleotide-diphospho-sugar transferase [Meira miltonrushii]|uniref:Nucleotide-diphospho-sugar transferase n=1 Tax=Meira miltonrushii TaxID=1280837 RepID=A0A316VGN9_9BASI|nr:nucleotide-diphospho-sugar transferase [Meira miltonrushii]PWN36799.1 nucleotide-diphospho-sugar transferase [Meira miltonrushii]